MTKAATPETLLNDQLAACLAAMQDCLAHARDPRDDPHGHLRRHDIATVGKLMKASARLTEALAKLKGETRQDIYVLRGDAPQARIARGPSRDKGEG